MRSLGTRLSGRGFALALLGIALVAFGVRLGYAENVYGARGLGDDWWYHWMAEALAAGRGFNNPLETLVNGHAVRGFAGTPIPTAYHPPLFPVVLAIGSKLGLTSYGAHRAIGCALGAGATAVVGLCGRRIGGPALGVASAAAAALFPPLVANDSTLLSESLYGLLIAGVVLAALRVREAPTYRRAAVLGLLIGLAALTRSEAALLVVLLVPFVGRPSWRAGLVAAGVAALLVVPWCIRNTIEFERPVTIATGDGFVLAGANTQATYHGDLLGAWDVGGLHQPAPAEAAINEAVGSDAGRRHALDFAGDHLGRLPIVIAARALRTWNLYPFSPIEQVRQYAFFSGSTRWVQWLSMVAAWIAIVLAVLGVVALRRRRAPLAPLLAPVGLVTLVSVLFNGDPRYRDAADISLVLLATAGVFSLWRQRAAAVPGLALLAMALGGCGSATSKAASAGCRYPKGAPLPDDIRQPEATIIRRATRILRRAAKTDLRSGLPQVLAGSGYRIEETGTWAVSDKPGHGRPGRTIGGVFVIAVDRPHRANTTVLATGTGWPPGSPNYRYSRRFGYVPFRAHFSAESLTGFSVLVDVRRSRVAEIGPGPDPSVTGFAAVAGHCPLRQPPPGYD